MEQSDVICFLRGGAEGGRVGGERLPGGKGSTHFDTGGTGAMSARGLGTASTGPAEEAAVSEGCVWVGME